MIFQKGGIFMIINTNDIKSSCRTMLINSMSSGEAGPAVPEPPADWVRPASWPELQTPAKNQIVFLISDAKRYTSGQFKTRILFNDTTTYDETTEKKICTIDWGDGTTTDVNVLPEMSSSSDIYRGGTDRNTYYVSHTYDELTGIDLSDRKCWPVTITMSTSIYVTNYKFLGIDSSTNYDMSTLELKMGTSIRFNTSSDLAIGLNSHSLLQSVEINNFCKSDTFRYCTSLQNVKLSTVLGKMSLPPSTFYECTSLRKFCSNSITKLEDYCFYNCKSLEYIEWQPLKTPFCKNTIR